MKIVDLKGDVALVDLDGVQRRVSVQLIEAAAVGDYVIVHSGFAIHKLDAQQARESLEILRQAAAAMDED